MTPWRFLDYITTEGRNLFAQWYAAQDDRVRAECEVTLGILRQTDDWEQPPIPQFKQFAKADVGLSEVRFYVDAPRPKKNPRRRRLRGFGVYRKADRVFVLMNGAEEWGRHYLPTDALSEARRQKARLDQGLGWMHERT